MERKALEPLGVMLFHEEELGPHRENIIRDSGGPYLQIKKGTLNSVKEPVNLSLFGEI